MGKLIIKSLIIAQGRFQEGWAGFNSLIINNKITPHY